MSKRQWIKWVAILVGIGLVSIGIGILLQKTTLGEAITWQKLTSPGQLSKGHAFLGNNCSACHTAVKGPDSTKCIFCHASNESLLQRQPTAFHGYVNTCRQCHIEHQGGNSHPASMDHVMLAKIGLRQLEPADMPKREDKQFGEKIRAWIQENPSMESVSGISPYEAVLNCAACHGNQDRHFKLFGQDCAQCHSTGTWKIQHFRHPSPRSTDCAQCHQAPPSHYMEHFQMISAKVAGQPSAKVNQCYLCHQTTSWNDIKGVGWYKHH